MTEPTKRARQADRDAVTNRLEQGYADGQLDRVEWESRTNRALSAKTLADLHGLVDDLQVDEDDDLQPLARPQRRRWLIGVVAAIVIAGAFGVRALTQENDPAPQRADRSTVTAPEIDAAPEVDSQPEVEPEPATEEIPEPLTYKAFQAFVKAYRDRFDTTVLYEPRFYDNGNVHFSVPYGPVGKNRIDGMFWDAKNGFDDWTDPETNTFHIGLVDLAKVDFKALARNVVHARKYLNVDNPEVSVSIERDPDLRPQVRVEFYVSNDFSESASMTTTLSGRQLSSSPFVVEGR